MPGGRLACGQWRLLWRRLYLAAKLDLTWNFGPSDLGGFAYISEDKQYSNSIFDNVTSESINKGQESWMFKQKVNYKG